MSKMTPIQWCDSTVNPTMGCDGCELWNDQNQKCYAGILHKRYGGYTKGYSPQFELITEYPGRMHTAARWSDLRGQSRPEKPWLRRVPRLIFVSDMSDALSADVSFEFLRHEVINQVNSVEGRRHFWLWLTKRPGRMAEFSSDLAARGIAWPDHLMPGTSVTTQATLTRADSLRRVGNPWTIRFLSVEPQIEPIDLTGKIDGIRWVIQGGESGRDARPFDLGWVRDLRQQLTRTGVRLFVKQLGSRPVDAGRPIKLKHSHGGDWSEWPEDLRVRELP